MTPDLTTLEADRRVTSPRPGRRLAPVLTVAGIAAVAAVAVAVTAITTSGNGSAPRPRLPASQVTTSALDSQAANTATPSSTAASTAAPTTIAPASRPSPAAPTGPPSQPEPVLLKFGAQQGRAQIPWNQVGPGWFLAAPYGTTSAGRPLYLVNPIGGRYLITDHLPHVGDYIAEWSPDGKRVMLTRPENNGHEVLTELELATGRVLHTFDAGQWASLVSYSRPQGRAILVVHADGKTSSFQRLGTDGSHQLTYPTTLPGFGGVFGSDSLYTADGAELLIGGKHGLALLGNDGHLIRVLPAPAGAQDCRPVTWWNSSTVLESCKVDLNPRFALLFQPIAGGSPTTLVDTSPAAHPFGFVTAWQYSGGMVLGEGSGCGPGKLDVLRDGVITRLKLPASVVTPTPVYGFEGDVITVLQRSNCGPNADPGSVISVNLVTGATTTMFQGNTALIHYPWQ